MSTFTEWMAEMREQGVITIELTPSDKALLCMAFMAGQRAGIDWAKMELDFLCKEGEE